MFTFYLHHYHSEPKLIMLRPGIAYRERVTLLPFHRQVRVQALAPRHKPGPKPRRPQLPPPKPYRPALPPSKPARRPPPPPPPASSPPRPPSPTLPPTAATTPSTTTQDPLSVHNLAGPPYFDTIPPEVLLMDETVTVPSLSSTTSVTTTTVPPYIAVSYS